MKIAIITDRPKSAISILAVDQQRHSPQHDIAICPVHPKKANAEQLALAQACCERADVIHVGYWKSGEVLKGKPWFDDKPKLLVHHNPYDLDKSENEWRDYDGLVVKNHEQLVHFFYREGGTYCVPHAIDFGTFAWEDEREDNDPAVGMVAGRIEGSKGLLQCAQACGELGYRFLLVGRLPGKHIEAIREAAQGRLDFREDISVQKLVEAYHEMRCLVVNSKDGFESGPLPALEAMATGTPIISRPVGMIPDIYTEKNLLLNEAQPEDVEALKACIARVMEDKGLRNNLRYEGFRSIRARSTQIAARRYSIIYHDVVAQRTGKPLVSVIVPTCDRADSLPRILAGVEAQTYPHLEVVVVDDSAKTHGGRAALLDYRHKSRHTVKYLHTGKADASVYGLAKARNLGVMESEGDVLVFLDDRLVMEPDAVAQFARVLEERGCGWLWGVKDGARKGFVENFSAVRRATVVAGGMFCERMEWYGGLTRETEARFKRIGVQFARVDEARATSIRKSRGWRGHKEDLILSSVALNKLYGGGN